MRLAQLARKVGKNQSEIVKFLTNRSIIIEDASNAKVEDKDALIVIEHFAPELLTALSAEIEEMPTEIISVNSVDDKPPSSAGQIENQEVSIVTNNIDLVDESQVVQAGVEKIELIKAPKIELQGLKVLGKIELPETKKKEPEKESQVKAYPMNEIKKNSGQKPQRELRKNPIALKREKEEQEKLQKQLEKAAYQKELRTQRYLNKVRKPVDIYKEPEEKKLEVPKPPSPAREQKSGSIISKFFRWLFPK